ENEAAGVPQVRRRSRKTLVGWKNVRPEFLIHPSEYFHKGPMILTARLFYRIFVQAELCGVVIGGHHNLNSPKVLRCDPFLGIAGGGVEVKGIGIAPSRDQRYCHEDMQGNRLEWCRAQQHEKPQRSKKRCGGLAKCATDGPNERGH